MEIISASQKRKYGHGPFQIEILYPGMALGSSDTGFHTIGRIDHAKFSPPGFVPMHTHRDDEILSYMRSGKQIHRDTAGHEEHISDAHLMLMNAGTGMQHEERALADIEMLQIFMRPSENGLPPKVQFHQFDSVYSINKWRLVAGDSENAPLELRTATGIFDARLSQGSTLLPPVSDKQVVHMLYCFNGELSLGDQLLGKGDAAIFGQEEIIIQANVESDLVLFQIDKAAVYSDTGMFSGNQYQ